MFSFLAMSARIPALGNLSALVVDVAMSEHLVTLVSLFE